jgi:hypothetical protein
VAATAFMVARTQHINELVVYILHTNKCCVKSTNMKNLGTSQNFLVKPRKKTNLPKLELIRLMR